RGLRIILNRPQPRVLVVEIEVIRDPARQLAKHRQRARQHRHPQVHRQAEKAKRLVRELFDAFFADPRLLPLDHQAYLREDDSPPRRARVVADYVAGMTDRYAIAEHARLFDPRQGTFAP
ncbi:MAG: hypothetical protein ACP5M3_06025, partial [Acidithiobacillus sp.]